MQSILNTSRIAIIGLGQLGTSLALRIKEVGCRELFAISRRPESLQKAVDDEIIDAGSTEAADILPIVDLAVLCLPLTATIDFVEANLEHFRFGGLVTDVGSVKGSIVRALRPKLLERGAYFIGSHPMAGSEKSGMAQGRGDLYQDAVVFMTPTDEDDPDAIHLLRAFWEAMGSMPIEINADRHDQACSFSSHMPHMVAAAIASSVLAKGDSEANQMACASGFRDVTRIAASNVHMWTDICRHNREAILRGLDTFSEDLTRLRAAIDQEDWEAVTDQLTEAKAARDDWFDGYNQQRGVRS